jgi:hypothetical protein
MANNSAKVEEVRREVADLKAQLSDCCPNVNESLTDLERELAKLKEEMRATGLKAVPLARLAADVAVSPPLASLASAKPTRKSPSLSPPAPAPPPRSLPVKVSPKQPKHFRPSVKKGKLCHSDSSETDEIYDIPHGIIAYLMKECGNVHDTIWLMSRMGPLRLRLEEPICAPGQTSLCCKGCC